MIRLRAIVPKGRSKLDPQAQRKAVFDGLQDAALEAQKDFQKTTSSWSHSVTFEIVARADGYEIGTKDDIWNMLNKGTKAHTIVPKSAKRLRFRGGYKAKTRPAWIGSGPGGASGSVVYRKIVRHPGTKARSWSQLIGKRWRALLGGYVQKRISEAVR